MKKIIVISLLVCLAILMVYASAMAIGEDVLIKPYTWDPGTTVYSDQNIILDAGWRACRRGAVQDFLTATNLAWAITGGDIDLSGQDTNNFWERPYEVQVIQPVEACMGGPLDTQWGTHFRYPVGNLPAGEYELYWNWWLDHPVTDVADYDGDGHPELFDGTVFEVTTTIHVEDR
jgi:hypothetical protein